MPTPNFEDAPDGSSSVNHTDFIFEESRVLWEDIDPWVGIRPYPPTEISSSAPPQGLPAPLAPVPAPDTRTLEEAFLRHVAALPPTFPVNAGETVRRPGFRVEPHQCSSPLPPPQTATQVNEAQRRARINPEWATAQVACPPPLAPPSPPRRPRARRLRESDPDAVVQKDPNAWSMREAVELCKLLEVVVPEAGFHIALTGGLLYKEGRRKDCDLMFYQIRQVEPNYEVLWKYLTVAGVIRSPSYPENGWLVKATYRGKAIDCLFPNAKKAKKAGTPNPDGYIVVAPNSPPTPPLDVAGFERSLAELDAERITAAARYVAALTTPSLSSTALCGPETTRAILEAAREIERESERRTGIVDPTAEARARIMAAPILVRHINGVPEFAAPPPPPPPPPPRCRICGLAVCGGCEVPF